jgi:hypothetical protein
MAGIVNNLRNNIPVKARVVIIITMIMVGGIAFYALSQAFGGSSDPAGAGVAKIETPPSVEDIRKDSPLDKPIFGQDSAVSKVYAEDEKKSAEEAEKKANTSHLDGLRIRLDEQAKAKEEVKRKEPPPPSSLQILLDKRKQEQEKAVQTQNAAAAQQQAQVATAQNPWAQFIAEEKRFSQDYANAYAMEFDKLAASHKKVAVALVESSDTTTTSSTSGASTRNSPALGSDSYQRLMNGGSTTGVVAGNQAPVAVDNAPASQAGTAATTEESSEVASYDYPSERLAAQTRGKASTPKNILVGETFYAMLQIGVNTDEISPIRAVVVENGKLQNAVLVGTPARVGEKAVLKFERMSVNGKSTSINAVALDPDTLRTGVADGVDRHTIERYSKLFAASFIEGFAEGLTGGQTTTNTDGSSSTITDALPNASDQALVGLGKVGERFAPIFEKEFERPPTVTVEPNKTIILMFMEDVDLNRTN